MLRFQISEHFDESNDKLEMAVDASTLQLRVRKVEREVGIRYVVTFDVLQQAEDGSLVPTSGFTMTMVIAGEGTVARMLGRDSIPFTFGQLAPPLAEVR